MEKIEKIQLLLEMTDKLSRLGLADDFTFKQFTDQVADDVEAYIVSVPDDDITPGLYLPKDITGFATYVKEETSFYFCYNHIYTGRAEMLIKLHEVVHIWFGHVATDISMTPAASLEAVCNGKDLEELESMGIIACRRQRIVPARVIREQRTEFVARQIERKQATVEEINFKQAMQEYWL